MVLREGRFKRFDRTRLFLFLLVIALGMPVMAQAEAGPQDRGYFAMRLPDAAIAKLSGQMQPVILPLEEGYYRYRQSSDSQHYAENTFDDNLADQPSTFAAPEKKAPAPEWGAYDDWGGWQEYVGR